MSAYPATAWNINVISSGSPQTGKNLQGSTFEIVGSMPPQSGMPVYVNPTYMAYGAQQYVKVIDPWYGFVTIGPSGALTDPSQSFFRHYPNEVFVFLADAVKYGFPSGANNILLQNVPFVQPTTPVRGTDLMPGEGFLHG